MIFFFEFVYMMDYINEFSYNAYLIVVNDGFDVFLNSVCENFVYFLH